MNQAEFPGHLLRERREALGLSRLDVFEHIRVPVQYLEALEDADFRELPCAAYAVGFLASYCQFLGLEPDPFVDHYWSRVREVGATRQATASRFFPARSDSGEGRPRWMTELIAWGAICGILLLGWLTYAVVVRPLTESTETRVDAGAHEAPPVHFEEEF
jgi:cytoskeletal protein RodZ